MDCQNQKWIVHTACVEEYSNSTKEIIGCEKSENCILGRLVVKKWVEDKKVHRQTAELEGEVPQVVVPVIHNESQK